MGNIAKKDFDTEMLKRDMLSESGELVGMSQEWFDKLMKEYLQVQKQHQNGYILTIHRALLICILNNSKTISIEFAGIKVTESSAGRSLIIMELYYIKGPQKANALFLHDNDEFAGGAVYHDHQKSKYRLKNVGNNELQAKGKEIIKRIKRVGFLENLLVQKTQKKDKTRILKILENLDMESITDIKTLLAHVKNT